MADESRAAEIDTSAVFTDTSVLFDYAIDDVEPAEELLLNTPQVAKLTSKRGKNEFESVCSKREAVHRELQSCIPGELEEFEPNGLDNLSKNDWDYITELFNELLSKEDDAEALRRLNEEKRKLKTARRELFDSPEAALEVVEVGPIDIQLRDSLATEIDNMDDVRLLCDVVEWAREGGTGVFLTSDETDFLPKEETDSEEDVTQTDQSSESPGLPSDLGDFLEGDTESRLDRINQRISSRYSSDATVSILRTDEFLSRL